MVLDAGKYARREGFPEIGLGHLQKAIDDWEPILDPGDIDTQRILAIKASSKLLRPDDWQERLAAAESRIRSRRGAGGPWNHPGNKLFPRSASMASKG